MKHCCRPSGIVLLVIALWTFQLYISIFYADAFQMGIRGYAQPMGILPSHSTVLKMVNSPVQDANSDTNNRANGDQDIKDELPDIQSFEPMSLPIQLKTQRAIPQPNKPSSRTLPSNWLGEKGYILSTAALIGLATGTNIAVFKKAVEFVREILYGDGIEIPSWMYHNAGIFDGEHYLKLSESIPVALAPAVGGLLVGILLKIGGDLPPGLRDTVTEG